VFSKKREERIDLARQRLDRFPNIIESKLLAALTVNELSGSSIDPEAPPIHPNASGIYIRTGQKESEQVPELRFHMHHTWWPIGRLLAAGDVSHRTLSLAPAVSDSIKGVIIT
jgi:hypothetical protein